MSRVISHNLECNQKGMTITYMFNCRDCGLELLLDDDYLSKNGKQIPLERTFTPHKCLKRDSSIFKCQNGCGANITFRDYAVTNSGKHIPLNAKTLARHRCPKKPFNKNTRKQWWYEQQAKARRQREEARQQYEQDQRERQRQQQAKAE